VQRQMSTSRRRRLDLKLLAGATFLETVAILIHIHLPKVQHMRCPPWVQSHRHRLRRGCRWGNKMKGFKMSLVERRSPFQAGVAVVALAAVFCLPAEIAAAQTSGMPWWMPPVRKQALAIPAAQGVTSVGTKPPFVIPQSQQDANPAGALGTF